MFDDFHKARENAKRDGEVARMMADDGAEPEVDGHYTVSPDFVCGDRSWSRGVFKVLALSGPNALILCVGGENYPKEPFILTVADRAWYPADDMMNALALQSAIAATEQPTRSGLGDERSS